MSVAGVGADYRSRSLECMLVLLFVTVFVVWGRLGIDLAVAIGYTVAFFLVGAIVSLDVAGLTLTKAARFAAEPQGIPGWALSNATWHAGLLAVYIGVFDIAFGVTVDLGFLAPVVEFFAGIFYWFASLVFELPELDKYVEAVLDALSAHLFVIVGLATLMIVWTTYSQKIISRPSDIENEPLPVLATAVFCGMRLFHHALSEWFSDKPNAAKTNRFLRRQFQAALVAVDMLALAALMKSIGFLDKDWQKGLLVVSVAIVVYNLTGMSANYGANQYKAIALEARGSGKGTNSKSKKKGKSKKERDDTEAKKGKGRDADSGSTARSAFEWILITLRVIEPWLIFYFTLQLVAQLIFNKRIHSVAFVFGATFLLKALVDRHGFSTIVHACIPSSLYAGEKFEEDDGPNSDESHTGPLLKTLTALLKRPLRSLFRLVFGVVLLVPAILLLVALFLRSFVKPGPKEEKGYSDEEKSALKRMIDEPAFRKLVAPLVGRKPPAVKRNAQRMLAGDKPSRPDVRRVQASMLSAGQRLLKDEGDQELLPTIGWPELCEEVTADLRGLRDLVLWILLFLCVIPVTLVSVGLLTYRSFESIDALLSITVASAAGMFFLLTLLSMVAWWLGLKRLWQGIAIIDNHVRTALVELSTKASVFAWFLAALTITALVPAMDELLESRPGGAIAEDILTRFREMGINGNHVHATQVALWLLFLMGIAVLLRFIGFGGGGRSAGNELEKEAESKNDSIAIGTTKIDPPSRKRLLVTLLRFAVGLLFIPISIGQHRLKGLADDLYMRDSLYATHELPEALYGVAFDHDDDDVHLVLHVDKSACDIVVWFVEAGEARAKERQYIKHSISTSELEPWLSDYTDEASTTVPALLFAKQDSPYHLVDEVLSILRKTTGISSVGIGVQMGEEAALGLLPFSSYPPAHTKLPEKTLQLVEGESINLRLGEESTVDAATAKLWFNSEDRFACRVEVAPNIEWHEALDLLFEVGIIKRCCLGEHLFSVWPDE